MIGCFKGRVWYAGLGLVDSGGVSVAVPNYVSTTFTIVLFHNVYGSSVRPRLVVCGQYESCLEEKIIDHIIKDGMLMFSV